jgi:hypothetical protein
MVIPIFNKLTTSIVDDMASAVQPLVEDTQTWAQAAMNIRFSLIFKKN